MVGVGGLVVLTHLYAGVGQTDDRDWRQGDLLHQTVVHWEPRLGHLLGRVEVYEVRGVGGQHHPARGQDPRLFHWLGFHLLRQHLRVLRAPGEPPIY